MIIISYMIIIFFSLTLFYTLPVCESQFIWE